MPGRVGLVQAAGQNGDGRGPDSQRTAVRGGINAVSAARDDDPALLGEIGGDLARDVLAVPGGGP